MNGSGKLRAVMQGFLVAVLLLFGAPVHAQQGDVPSQISYQGHLLSDGVPVDGTRAFVFTLRTAGGDAVWQVEESVNVDNGVFSVLLGGAQGDPALAEAFHEHADLFLHVSSGGDDIDEVQLSSVPYAVRAGWADEVAEDGAVRELNGRTGALTLASSGLVDIADDGNTIVVSLDENDVVHTLRVQEDDAPIRGEVTLRGEGNAYVYSDGQEIVIQASVFSSERYKQEIEPLVNAVSLVQQLQGVTFSWKEDGRPDIGLIAEAVKEVLPEAVVYDPSGETVEGLQYHSLIGVLVEAVKEQQQTISSLEDRLERLERLVEGH